MELVVVVILVVIIVGVAEVHSEPKFPSTEWATVMEKIRLIIQPAEDTNKNAVQLFAKQVVLILHSCNPSEYWAALEKLKPPTTEDDSEIQDRPIIYPQDDSVIGWFAGYRAAVVKTQRDKSCNNLTNALTKSFPNGQVIIQAGMAYANDRKCKFADVLISEKCTVVGDEITNPQIDTNVMRVFKDPAKDWSARKSFTCANESNRTSVAHIGHIVSASSLEMLREQLLHAPNTIGGEIEGWVLFEVKKTLKVQNKKDIQIIIINGVSDYHDLTMGDKWRFTAAKAAMDCIHYCLEKSGGTEFNADNIAREEAREQHYEAYTQALKKEAVIPLKYLKVLFFGPPRTGKTSMRRRLVGEIQNLVEIQNLADEPVQVSTGTAECYDVIIKEDKITTSTTVITESKWSSVKVLFGKERNSDVLNEELQLLYQLIYRLPQTKKRSLVTPIENKPLDENKSPVLPNENEPLNENTSPDKLQSSVNGKEKVVKTTESNSNTSTPRVTLVRGQEYELNAEDIERTEIEKEFEDFDKILRTFSEEKIKDLLEGTILMNMVDTGGQPAFLEMLPALTMGPALYLIFFRLNQELKRTYEIQYVSKDNEQVSLGDSSYTVEEVIFQALSSIACFSCAPSRKTNMPPRKTNMPNLSHAAVLVGTHKDELKSDTEAKIKDKDDALKKNIREILNREFHEIDSIIVHSFSEDQLVFAIDNMTGDEAELTNVRKKLEKVINQMFYGNRFLIPASWLMFSIFLRKMGRSTMSLSQCRMIGERLNVKDTDEALWFLHHYVGVLMHFPEVNEIKDIVICNPQIVFDSVTKLILHSFKVESVPSSICKKFKEDGQFRFEDIQKISENTKGDCLPLPQLVKLLNYLNIISPIKPQGNSPQSDVYFIPAVLRHAKENEVSMKQSTTDPIPPLMIHFKCGFVPVGVFCAKIASLVSQGWKLNKSGHILCKNRATFRIFDGTHDITLISMPKWFEIHIARIATVDRALQEICKQVLKTVCNTLDQVISRMNYKQFLSSDETPYELGFKCPKHLYDDHLAINKPKEGVEAPPQSSKSLWFWLNYPEESVMKCHNEDLKVDFTSESLVWFGKGIPVITRHPQDQSVTTEANIDFHVEVTGDDKLQFQWQKDGKDIDISERLFSSEQTSGTSTLHIRCVKKSDEGCYKCLVKNSYEKSGILSSAAELRVFLELNVKNVLTVLREAGFADADWEELGLQLIDRFEFTTIKADHDQANLCMMDTISQWLKSDRKASWEKLAGVLLKVPGYGEATATTVRENAGIAVTSDEKRDPSLSRSTSIVERQVLELDVKNVLTVLREAGFADADWEELGLQLIDRFEFTTIKADHDQANLCMMDTISQWLKSDRKASWEKLAGVLLKVPGYGEATATTVRENAGIAVTSDEKRVPSLSRSTSIVERQGAVVTLEAESIHPQPTLTLASTTVDIPNVRSTQLLQRKRKRTDLESESSSLTSTPKRKHPAAEENPAEKPQVELTIGDLVEVTNYLQHLGKTDIYNLGLTLGLHHPHLKHMASSETFREDMIAAWLQKEDQVTRRGVPTWETLVKALKHSQVNQTGVAMRIETEKLK